MSRPWTPEDTYKLQRAVSIHGKNVALVARAIGRAKSTVQRHIEQRLHERVPVPGSIDPARVAGPRTHVNGSMTDYAWTYDLPIPVR